MRIAVIGGGLGGLTATISLTQAGHEVTLFEQREWYTEVGCGISVWPNAMRALDELGLGAEVRAHGVHHCSGAFLTTSGGRLFEPGAQYFETFGDTCVVHRKELVGILAEAVAPRKSALGTKVTGVGLDGTVIADGERPPVRPGDRRRRAPQRHAPGALAGSEAAAIHRVLHHPFRYGSAR
ncbi:FAD-dependent oxidoreductase [Mycobacteroides salmoniphilum]|uniref:FAD-dependent oxidoreductase n=1 Tax=Mycobacteroides salmoniphilum TaxID=404941 RepID=UPI0012FF67FB|nr:FAD-dependent monooxygenase [Mycobacteroides salmoniphilum]